MQKPLSLRNHFKGEVNVLGSPPDFLICVLVDPRETLVRLQKH